MGSTLMAKMKPHAPAVSEAFPKMNRVPSSANEITFETPAATASNAATTGGNRRSRNASANWSATPVTIVRTRIERRCRESA